MSNPFDALKGPSTVELDRMIADSLKPLVQFTRQQDTLALRPDFLRLPISQRLIAYGLGLYALARSDGKQEAPPKTVAEFSKSIRAATKTVKETLSRLKSRGIFDHKAEGYWIPATSTGLAVDALRAQAFPRHPRPSRGRETPARIG